MIHQVEGDILLSKAHAIAHRACMAMELWDEPYLFVSEDGGLHWRSVRGDLPASAGSTRCLREDLTNPDILYLGCEFGAWVSLDRGEHWQKFGNLPLASTGHKPNRRRFPSRSVSPSP